MNCAALLATGSKRLCPCLFIGGVVLPKLINRISLLMTLAVDCPVHLSRRSPTSSAPKHMSRPFTLQGLHGCT